MLLPMQVWYVENIVEISNAAVILHNMMVHRRTENVFENRDNDGVLSGEWEKNANIVNIQMSDVRAC